MWALKIGSGKGWKTPWVEEGTLPLKGVHSFIELVHMYWIYCMPYTVAHQNSNQTGGLVPPTALCTGPRTFWSRGKASCPTGLVFCVRHLRLELGRRSSLCASRGDPWQQQGPSRPPASLPGRAGSRVPMELEHWPAYAQHRQVLACGAVSEGSLRAICPACSGHCREGSLSSGSCAFSLQRASFYPEGQGLSPH